MFRPAARPVPSLIAVEGEIEIAHPLGPLFDLIDPRAPESLLRQLGFRFREATPRARRVMASAPDAQDTVHTIDIDAFAPPTQISFCTRIEAPVCYGAVIATHSDYRLTALESGRTHVALVETARLLDGVARRVRDQEGATLQRRAFATLGRLKMAAEMGVTAVLDFDRG